DQNLLRSKTHELQIQIAQLSERNKSLLMDIERLNQQRETVQANIHDNSNLVFQKKIEISETEDACSRLQTLLLETVRAHDEQKASIQQQEKEKEELVREIELQETVVVEARALRDRTREQRSNIEVEKARIEQQKQDLIGRCSEEMGMELESLQLAESEWNELGDEDLKSKLLEIEAKLERLGSINMLALEEYGAMEERHTFLKTQYDDLKASIENLLDTIQRIDATSLKRFQEAFDAVQTHFQDLFQRLFNGGKAEMVLSDNENPGESGIEIHVQPPGKRLQNMNLMSGGEKTLTGIAFLMALFQYHASPFCVMDEVDAALDEVNVQRFTALIAEAKKQVQFLIVTHNKRTMEAADQLYGVTMGEPGVSTILSARFEDAEALIDA
ncbi:MAG TPA: hypothetical protein VJ521_05935, partial [Acidobacteriota bacterium]|nr:hypothetical protein [Acidobacteriota bacterium]